uniref:Uncharacterized protein n=1 Tax=Amphimedon queenslandica TaxID=400682 RepID=A0A1X7TRB9_AMPQE
LFQPELLSSLCLAVSWPILGTLHPFINLGVVNYHQQVERQGFAVKSSKVVVHTRR